MSRPIMSSWAETQSDAVPHYKELKGEGGSWGWGPLALGQGVVWSYKITSLHDSTHTMTPLHMESPLQMHDW